ncbi:radical SAM superfamily protein [bacterium BMS3Abin14]|nr:radical SAM superfamily protein [bacterium BMS3Abin14]
MNARSPLDEAWVSPRPARGGSLRVAVAYPNSYWVGMSNLGYQAVLRGFLDVPGFDVRRVFWEGSGLYFPDGSRSLSEFDVVAFSVSFQPDLVHLPRMLEAGGVAPFAPEAAGPFVLGGGAALTINPEPVAQFFDLIIIGDSEPVFETLPDILLSAGPSGSRDRILELAAGLPGAYVPSMYSAGEVKGSRYLIPRPLGSMSPWIERSMVSSLDVKPARPAVVARGTEFGSMYPLEISRGCGAKCSFCAASHICGPVRFLGLERMEKEVRTGLKYRRKIGLVGTAVSYHPELLDAGRMILDLGGRFSPSSVRLERMTPELAEMLAASGHRTVSLAPEAGTSALRKTVGKGFSDDAIMEAVNLLQRARVPGVKVYFMVGLPGEEDDDMAAISDLVGRIRDKVVGAGRKRGKVGNITVSVNPFVPKPHTPLEREPMAAEDVLSRRLKSLREKIGRMGGVRFQAGSMRGAYLDALISLGDRNLGKALGALPAGGISLRKLQRIFPDADRILFDRRNGKLPWTLFGGRSGKVV